MKLRRESLKLRRGISKVSIDERVGSESEAVAFGAMHYKNRLFTPEVGVNPE